MAAPTKVTVRDYFNLEAVTSFPASGQDYDVFNNALVQQIEAYVDSRAEWQAGYVNADKYASLNAAIVAIDTAQKVLVISNAISCATSAVAVTIPPNVSIFPLQGGVIKKGSATSLTINGPVVGNPMHRWLSGFAAGEVTFGVAQKIHPKWIGTTTEAVKIAIVAAAANSEIELDGLTYTTYNGQITIDKALKIDSKGTLTFSTNANNQGLLITASNVTLKNFEIVGPQYTASDNTQRGIFAYGADVNNFIENIVIENTNIHNFVQGIRLDFVKNFQTNKNRLENLYTVGVQCLSVTDGEINENYIRHVYSSGYSYDGNGIILTYQGTTESANPVCKRVNIIGNIIKEVPALCGIYLKGTEDCVVDGNNVKDCWNGIYLERRINPTDLTYDLPNKRNIVTNNVVWVNHGVGEIMTLANTNNGITSTGGVYYSGSGILNLNLGCIVSNNRIEGYQAGIATSQTIDNIISNNSISHVTRGIYLNGEDVNIQVIGNTVRNLFAGSFSMAGIVVERGNPAGRPNESTGLVANNVIDVGSQIGIANESNYNLGINFENNIVITTVAPYKHITDLSYFTGNIHPYIKTSKLWTPGSIAAGASASVTHNILGLSNISRLSAIITPNTDLLGLTIGYAFTDDTPGPSSITLYLYNTSAGAIDIGTVTFYIEIRHNAA